jgi:hypothetical protein
MGIGNIMSFRIARFNIGHVYASHFNENEDTPQQKYISRFDGAVMAHGKIGWWLTRVCPPDQTGASLMYNR